MTLKNFIELGVDHAVNNFDQMASLYKKEYGEVLCSACAKKSRQNIVYMYGNIKQRMMKPKCAYQMKSDALIDIPLHKSSDRLPYGMWNRSNVTTEVAVKLINAGYGSRFVGHPTSAHLLHGVESLGQLTFDELSIVAIKNGIDESKINESTKEELIQILLS